MSFRFTLLIAGLLFSAGLHLLAAEFDADFYVSPNGSDAWSGTLPKANAEHIYFCASNRTLGTQQLMKQLRDGVDDHSLAVDPLSVDAANGDFRLKPESPARKMGFVPFDMSKVGLAK